jgi:hypothetical protein
LRSVSPEPIRWRSTGASYITGTPETQKIRPHWGVIVLDGSVSVGGGRQAAPVEPGIANASTAHVNADPVVGTCLCPGQDSIQRTGLGILRYYERIGSFLPLTRFPALRRATRIGFVSLRGY